MTDSEKIDLLLNEMSIIKEDISYMKEDISSTKEELTSVKLTLENVINRNINIIAEGHLDISRKLDEALKSRK